jgi:CheY-like chemotaxis protein
MIAAIAEAAPAPKYHPRTGAFDLLLTDIQMPVMDGIALALAAGIFGPMIR